MFKPFVDFMAMAFKGFKYGTHIHGFLAAIFRPFMSYPSDAPGLFSSGPSENNVQQWGTLVSGDDVSSQCQLERVVYGKCTKSKEHEFLLLYFRHPTQKHTVAIMVLDRMICEDSTQNGSGSSRQVVRSSRIASPSVSKMPAHDSTYTAPEGSARLNDHLSTAHGPFKECAKLIFPASARPSAIQVSALLTTVSKFFPDYHLYHRQCYWYAHTVFEALKKLFNGDEILLNEGRYCWLGVRIDKADSVEAICKDYHEEWAPIEHAAEKKRKEKEDEARQLRMEGLAEGHAQSQAQVNQALANEMDATRKADEVIRKAEEAERKAEEYRVQMNQMQARIAQFECRAE
ncbi:hypothetical protein EV702DRAFT_1228398 [Suillus placidus]|uniref:Uncharacterized protein n=1 Tax=Suillus placidus TaxID=48579 RepID=A0A9P7D1G4_9AGAM|nr:hypothetical protein EV702DRAFT_1228398 [Suillus placidus]